jgi:hypothetical protein
MARIKEVADSLRPCLLKEWKSAVIGLGFQKRQVVGITW